MPLPRRDDRKAVAQSSLVFHDEEIPLQFAPHGSPWHDHHSIPNTPQSELVLQSPKRPPRPLNSYMLFLTDFRKNNADSTEKLTTIDGGKAWRELPPERKEYYKQRAIEAKRKHALQYPAYTLQPKKGSERKPYGSRKRHARQTPKPGANASETPSPAIGSLAATQFTFDSGSLLPNYPYQPGRDARMQSTTAFNSPYHHTFDVAQSHAPEQYSSALGLSHVPHPHPPPSLLITDTSFSSSTTSLDSLSLPIQASGFDSSPSTSSNSSSLYYSTETPPTPHNLSLSPYTHSPSMNQPAYESANLTSPYLSPHLNFQQLTLHDDFPPYPSTSASASASASTLPHASIFHPIALPSQSRVIDQESFPFPEVSNLSQDDFSIVAFTSSSSPMAVAHYNSMAADWSPNIDNDNYF